MKGKTKKLISKAKNNRPIRVLYKKVGQIAEVKIVSLRKFKKAIIERNLVIIPYENLYIICKSKKPKVNMGINIFLPLQGVSGDLIVVKINRKEREIESLSQDEIIWYTKDLIHRSPIKRRDNNKIKAEEYSKNKEEHNKNEFVFENELIQILTNIEFTFKNLLIHIKKKSQ